MVRRLILAAVVAALAAGLVALPALAKPARPKAQFMFDTASYGGADTSLSCTARGRHQVQLTGCVATLQMPPGYASHHGVGGFCAYAEFRVAERTVWTSWTGCDTTDDARLRYHFPARWVPANTEVSVYFSDDRTRFLADHPQLFP